MADSDQTATATLLPATAVPRVRNALLVGAAAVAIVAIAVVVTALLPPDARDVVFRTPLLIVVLILGTGGVLWRITRPGRVDR